MQPSNRLVSDWTGRPVRAFKVRGSGFKVLCLPLLFTLALSVSAAQPTNATAHAIAFTNGDALLGRLQSIDPQGVLVWRHPDAAAPITFAPGSATEVRFHDAVQPATLLSNRCLVKLTNLDELEGGLRSLDERELVLETVYAGTLHIPRSRVQTILPLSERLATVFSGPDGLEGWTIGKVNAAVGEAGQWRYLNGAFYAREAASVARDVKLPNSASLEFDIEWRGMLNMAVALYTDYLHPVSLRAKEDEPDFGGFYSLQINSQLVNLLYVNKRDPLRQLGQAIVPSLAQKNRARIAIKCSRNAPQVSLLVDGVIVRQWVDTEGFGAEGTGIRLVHQGQGTVRLSDLRVSEWDGRFEEAASIRTDGKNDLLVLVNSDKVLADLKEIRAGGVKLVASGNTLSVPLNRVTQIELAGGTQVRDGTAKDAVRAWFAQRGSMTFTLEKWDAEGAVATSPNFGRAVFAPGVFSRLEFGVGR
jgi:hypothetical protein